MEIDITDKVKKAARYSIISLIVLVLGVGIAIFIWQMQARYVTLSNGQIAGDLIKVKCKVPGVITEILVSDGEKIESGKVLAKMTIKISPEQIQELEKSVELAKARYEELANRPVQSIPMQKNNSVVSSESDTINLEKAKQEQEKMDKLFAIGGISGVQHKEAMANYERAVQTYQMSQNRPHESAQDVPMNNNEQLLKIAALQVEQAEKALKQAKEEIQIAEIKANVDGKVYLNEVKIGDEVEAEQDIFSIGSLQEIWLQIPIEENQLSKIRLGQFVKYKISNYPDQEFHGTVCEIIEDMGDAEHSYATKHQIRISIPADTELEIKPGMKAIAKISI